MTLYIDPGTGSILISTILAFFSVLFYMLKGFFYRKFNIKGKENTSLDTSKEYGLVFYSEGGQYWNVYKPIIEELSQRKVSATYFSSKKDDPGLHVDLPHIETLYVGAGSKLYYFLSRLRAEMVVTTTPGLDVLQMKRSKYVKHYTHITHSTAGVDYHAYGTEYFDSILVGGSSDTEFIRELERKRNSSPKEIEVIGCTYLDVQRRRLALGSLDDAPLFFEKRPTVLLSPTWGAHGLLHTYGKHILEVLEQSQLFNVIVRPHPQSFISEAKLMKELMTSFPDSGSRMWDTSSDGLSSMAVSDIMISDFSGIIYDFLLLFGKPTLSFSSQYDKRGRDSIDLDGDTWGIRTLSSVGSILTNDDIDNLPLIISETLLSKQFMDKEVSMVREAMDAHPNETGARGANFIQKKLAEIRELPSSLEAHRASPKGSFFEKVFAPFNLGETPVSNFFLQAIFALLLFVGYLYIGTLTFPFESYNWKFVAFGLPYTLLLLPFLVMVTLATNLISKDKRISFHRKLEPFELKEVLLIFLPLAPVGQYIISNQDILTIKDSLIVFGFFLTITFVIAVVIPWIYTSLSSRSFTTPLSLAFIFYVINMANVTGWFGFGKKWFQLVFFLLIFTVVFLLYLTNKKILYFLSIAFFVITIITGIVATFFKPNNEVLESEVSSHNTASLIGIDVSQTPDIYLLIYDSYSNEEMLDYYGIDNTEMFSFLLENNFAIYDGIYSVAASSVESMSHVLNMSKIPWNRNVRKVVAQDAEALIALKQIGYNVDSIFMDDYMIRGSEPTIYNTFFPDPNTSDSKIPSYKIIITAIFEGFFRFDADFSTITYGDFLQKKHQYISESSSSPRFLYAHSNFPDHSPSGVPSRPNEIELYHERLEVANREMRQDIDLILSHHPNSVIIVAADHGPGLTKDGNNLNARKYSLDMIDRYDVRDRYGAMLAIHWPKSSSVYDFDIRILQDALPAVFGYIAGDVSLFDKLRMDRKTLYTHVTGGVLVEDNVIRGGKDDGKPLFDITGVRTKKQVNQ
jgi:hypothetical protein